MTQQRTPFSGYKLPQLAKAHIKPEQLSRGLERLKETGFIEPAVVGMMYQLGRLDKWDANFLLKVKHPQRPKLDPHHAVSRHNLCLRMLEDLSNWEQGKELKHPLPAMKRNVIRPRTLCPKKQQAREKLRAELRLKRG